MAVPPRVTVWEISDSIVFSETIVCDLGVDTRLKPGFLTKTCQGFALKRNRVPWILERKELAFQNQSSKKYSRERGKLSLEERSLQ
ncbi:hypothetical protein TNCV_3452121 [Trichonephila clavipes]|nr:hypothetical protein TNCV_3452121 [Trichonephila clavipes]